MEGKTDFSRLPKPALYSELATQLRMLVEDESDAVANMANAAALIFYSLPRVNWAGFYLLKGEELVVGPFQGRPACVRIAFGRGVCGTAAEKLITVRVPNVAEFAGHIACDSASRSEIAVPMITEADAHLLGVLDVDSPDLDRFDGDDQQGLESIAAIIAAKL
jgi:L-methionine (R)-S-oxide reductase